MICFTIDDMSCNHCADTITRAVKALDPDAQVRIDLGRHLVGIESDTAGAEALRAVLEEAGYTPSRFF